LLYYVRIKFMKSYQNITLKDYLIAFLCSARSTHLFYKILNEREFKNRKSFSVRATLGRLQKQKLALKNKEGWSITENGKSYYKNKILFLYLPSLFDKKDEANKLLIFDIPETHRHGRNWLRNQLKIYGYIMVQRSVWQGPGPLPKEFFKRLQDLKIDKNIKMFTLSKNSK